MSERLAVVTGTSRGFGAAMATCLADAGWTVIATSRDPLPPTHPRVMPVAWGVTDDDTSPLIEAVGDRPVDLLVNNAGRGVPGAPLADLRVDDLLAVMNVNVGGVIRTCQALQPNLDQASAPIVVNVSSRLGSLHDQAAGHYREFTTSYAYRITKAAQNMTTIALAQELGPHVRFLALHPGELATDMGRDTARTDPSQAAREVLALVERGQFTSPAYLRSNGEDIPW